MASERIAVELPGEVAARLKLLAREMGVASVADAAAIAICEWVAGHQAELDRADSGQKYFVNEALDELVASKDKKTETEK